MSLPPVQPTGEAERTDAIERARASLEQDLRMAQEVARQDAEEEYLSDLRRLQVELREARETPQPVDLNGYEAVVRAAGDEIARLAAQLHALRPSPSTDRFFFTEAQIRRRAVLYEQTRHDLATLRSEKLAQLQQMLAVATRGSAPVAGARLADLERQRQERLSRALAALTRESEEMVAALPSSERWPAAAVPQPLAWSQSDGLRGRMISQVARARRAGLAQRQAEAAGLQAATSALEEQRRLLATRIREETEAAARNTCRNQHLEFRHTRTARLPDVTARVRSQLRAYFNRPFLAAPYRD
jgi:hypothetical protein